MTKKFCISCHQEGHTYLDCTEIPFGSLIAAAFGTKDLLGTKSQAELTDAIEKAERRKLYNLLKVEFE